MKLRVNVNLRPSGGYTFTDVEGMRHEADDLVTLIANLALYRERTGREAGDPLNEIQDQLIARYPKLKQR
jgi:hypothetical protein